MFKFFIIATLLIVGLDALGLYFVEELDFKYFVVTHLVLVIICFSIIFLKYYLQKTKPDYVGLGITAGLIFKMFFSLLIFVALYKKIDMSNTQIINFLFIYLLYTFVATFSVVKQ